MNARLWTAAAIAVVTMLCAVLVAPVARAFYLCAVIASTPMLGAAVLLCVADLTGGQWALASRPLLRALAAPLPALWIAAFVVAGSAPSIFNWLSEPHPEIASHYLAAWPFAARAVLILTAWTFLWWVARREYRTGLLPALALVAYAASMTIASVDWLMALEPPWASTSLAALWAILQIGAALGAVLVFDAAGPGRRDDIAQLAIAAILGVTYLGTMQYLVIWAGNLPDRAIYYVVRDTPAWIALVVVSIACGFVIPMTLLVAKAGRQSRRLTRLSGSSVLVGIATHIVWQIAPALPGRAPVVPAMACAMVAALACLAWRTLAPPTGRPQHG